MDDKRLNNFLFTGDYSFAEELIREYENNLYSLCRRLARSREDADDLYQQTWLKAMQNAGSYKSKSFRNWLYTICVNTYKDQCRRAKSREKVTNDHLDTGAKDYAIESATDGVSAESVAIDNYTKAMLKAKISRLPDKHRLPVVLHYFEGMDYKECASALGIPVGTIKSRLNSAKKKLLEEMEKTEVV